MLCYPIIECDSTVQLGDKLRIDLSKTFVARPDSISAIKKIEVQPTASAGWQTIHDKTVPANVYQRKDWYLDWVYLDNLVATVPTDTHTIKARVTLDDDTLAETERTITLLTSAQDALFSDDNNLLAHEFDILKWLPEGRSSWTYVHRRAQSRIIATLSERNFRVYCPAGVIEKKNLMNTEDFREWSTFLTLHLIFSTVLNSKGDVFTEKSKIYENQASRASNRIFKIDSNDTPVQTEYINLGTIDLVRG